LSVIGTGSVGVLAWETSAGQMNVKKSLKMIVGYSISKKIEGWEKKIPGQIFSSGSIKFVSSCSVAQAFAGVIRSMKSEQAVREAKTW